VVEPVVPVNLGDTGQRQVLNRGVRDEVNQLRDVPDVEAIRTRPEVVLLAHPVSLPNSMNAPLLTPVRTVRRMDAPVEIPMDIEDKISAICLALPEVTVRIDQSQTSARSTAHSFDIRKRSFCLLVATSDAAGQPSPLLILRASPAEREALLSVGHPYFVPRAGHDRLGVLLTKDTDREEIRQLVTESYRVLAPKKLIELLDQPP